MKFGRILKSQIEEAPPEWRDQYLSYKKLKKRLKLIFSLKVFQEAEDETPKVIRKRPRVEALGVPESVAERESDSYSFAKRNDSNDCASIGSNQDDDLNDIKDMSAAEFDFIELLNPELEKFNDFVMAKEKEYIIRQKELQERIQRARNTVGRSGKQDLIKVSQDVVKFHGEMVLLESYSILNFTGLVKITKKYDKRTGGILRLAFIQKVLGQPFFTMELLFKLVKQCEETLHNLFSSSEDEGEETEDEEEETEDEAVVDLGQDQIYRSTMAALRSMKEMRRGSSTYGPFSLPPLHHDMPPASSSSIPTSHTH